MWERPWPRIRRIHRYRGQSRSGNFRFFVSDWHTSIALRLSLAFALLATLVFAALGVYLNRSADEHMAELDAHELLGKLALIRHVGARASSPEVLAARLADALIGEHGVVVGAHSGEATIFVWPENGPGVALAQGARGVGEMPERLGSAGRDYRVVAGPLLTGWGQTARVVVARDIAHHTEFLDRMQRDFWLAVLAAALLTALVGALIARRGMRPVRNIALAAGRISAGQLAERIAGNDVPPELAELVEAFNAMLARLEESFRRLSDFSADLAHELRTPLHTLRVQTEVSLGKLRSVDEYRELLASSLEEYDRLSRIVGDMLFLAKAENGLAIPRREPVRLRELCQRLLDYYGILAENIELSLDGEDLTVPGDRLMLQRAIGNLLVNAIHHTPPQGIVALHVHSDGAMAVVSIVNSGSGIPAEALQTIFDRFVRLDRSNEGSGLGLAIARSAILAHGGRIEARALAAATEFTVLLPR